MKILIIRVYPNKIDINNYNVQEIGLAKALINEGHKCDIALYNGLNKDKVEKYEFKINDKTSFCNIYWLRGISIIKNGYLFSLKKLIKEYDVIQVNEYDQLQSWLLYKSQIVPTVVYHGTYSSDYTKRYNIKCLFFDTLFFNKFTYDSVICATKSKLAKEFVMKKGFKHVHCVGVGLDRNRFPETKIVRDNSKGLIRLIYVGKIEKRRNSLFLLDVFEELLSKGVNVEFRVIGKGEGKYYSLFMNRAQMLIDLGVLSYTKALSQSELGREYSEADLFLFPSQYEIFGMVLLEAMYFGCPVITSMNGGASELIDNGVNGSVINDFDVKKWTEEIERLSLDSEQLCKYSVNSKKKIEKYYLWETVAKKMVNIYTKAVDNK